MARTRKHRTKGHPSGVPGGRPKRNINRSRNLAALGHDISVLGGGPKRINTANYIAADNPTCGAHIPDPITGELEIEYYNLVRKRATKMGPAGSLYGVRVIKSPICGEPAVVSKSEDGKRIHRCARHSFSDE